MQVLHKLNVKPLMKSPNSSLRKGFVVFYKQALSQAGDRENNTLYILYRVRVLPGH